MNKNETITCSPKMCVSSLFLLSNKPRCVFALAILCLLNITFDTMRQQPTLVFVSAVRQQPTLAVQLPEVEDASSSLSSTSASAHRLRGAAVGASSSSTSTSALRFRSLQTGGLRPGEREENAEGDTSDDSGLNIP